MIPNKLIDKALKLTGKTMEDIEEKYAIYANTTTEFGIIKYRFSIEKFCYYLLSESFIENYLDALYQYAKISKPERLRIIAWRFWDAIFLYQSWNEQPLIDLLTKI